jgi:hypothetical protein
MKEQHIDEAIRITEGRLAALKGAVSRKRGAVDGVERVCRRSSPESMAGLGS